MPEMIAGAREFIAAPPITPLGGGVLDAARVIDTDGHELMGATYQSDACATVEEWGEWCTNSPLAAKLFESAYTVVVGDPFAIYAGVECDFQRVDEAATRARNRLSYGEARAVDRNVLAQLEDIAVDLGGPFPVTQAIGIVEGYMATVYGGVPTLLIPRIFLPCACGSGTLRRNMDDSVSTCSGSTVAAVTTEISDPMAATATVYVTGQITLLRSSVTAISVPPQTRTDGTYDPARALAERVYVPLFECVVAKVEASCS